MKDFAAIDFETANNERSSVCSVGIVIVRNGEIVDKFYSLIKPEPEYYTYWCSRVHGLSAADTQDAPVFPEVWKQIEPKIAGLPLVAHNKAFDESCLKAVFRVYQMTYPSYPFFCTCVASRRVWPQGQHTLDVIAARCGYDLTRHHHALADAEACAAIAIKLFGDGDDPYYMEAADIVYARMRQLGSPIKAADLAQLMDEERKTIDAALRRLKTEGRVASPKRGYYQAE